MKTSSIVMAALLSGLLLAPNANAHGDSPSSIPAPYTWTSKSWRPDAQLPTLDLPAVDRQALLSEDEANYAPNRGEVGNKRMRIAFGNDVTASSRSEGTWETLADGSRVWRLRVAAPNATELHLGLSHLNIPVDAEIYVYSLDEQYAAGPYGAGDINQFGELWIAAVPGDEAVVALRLPNAKDEHQIGVKYVGTGYRDLFGREGDFVPMGTGPGASGACNINVVCPLGNNYSDEIRSVAHYSFVSGGTFICTGSLVNNHAQDGKPYFITANHCVSSNTVAGTMTFYWNYQSTQCASLTGYSMSQNQSGAQLRMTRAATDTTLVELNAVPNPAFNVYYSGWDATGVTPGGIIGIHHPSGDAKKIMEDNNGVTTMNNCIGSGTNTHWRTGAPYSQGTTEGGSSGSGIWVISGDPSGNQNLLIGVLSGGSAACSGSLPNSGYDCYGKFSESWEGANAATRLRDWLDPSATGVLTRPGSNGGPLPEADLAIALDATPNPVDIGDPVTIDVDVTNNGPDATTGVSAVISLPTGVSYSSASPASWTCGHSSGTVTCSLAGSLANGASAPTLAIVANITAGETGTVIIGTEVSAASDDPTPGNNQASLDLEITGKPPLPDAIFCSGFESGQDGSCAPPPNPDIVVVGPLNVTIPDDFGGLSANWLTQDFQPGEINGYHFNPYRSNTAGANNLSFWFQLTGSANAGGVSLNGTEYAVLAPGAVIGLSSTFINTPQATPTAPWRQAGGVNGYLGFRFTNTVTSQINYGYVRLSTTGTSGFPATILGYAYNSAGDPITIPDP